MTMITNLDNLKVPETTSMCHNNALQQCNICVQGYLTEHISRWCLEALPD